MYDVDDVNEHFGNSISICNLSNYSFHASRMSESESNAPTTSGFETFCFESDFRTEAFTAFTSRKCNA